MINICYCLNIKRYSYLYFLASSISSVLSNTNKDIIINIFHDNSFIDSYKDQFTELVLKYGQQIKFYLVDNINHEDLKLIKKVVPKYQIDVFALASFYRLFICNFLDQNIEKYIYLDVDIIVNFDIDILFKENLEGYPLGAIPEFDIKHNKIDLMNNCLLVKNNIIPAQKYLNSGVLLFDLKKFKQHYYNFLSYTLGLFNKVNAHLPDQDMLNLYFYDNYKHLNPKYNIFVKIERSLNIYDIKDGIYHYVGSSLFKNSFCDLYDELFLGYFSKSNFFDFNILNKISNKICSSYRESYSNFSKFFNFFKKYNIIIFFDYVYEDFVKKNFVDKQLMKLKIEDGKIFLNDVIEFLIESKNTKIILFTAYYNLIKSELQKHGILEYKIFINGLKMIYKDDEEIKHLFYNIFYT